MRAFPLVLTGCAYVLLAACTYQLPPAMDLSISLPIHPAQQPAAPAYQTECHTPKLKCGVRFNRYVETGTRCYCVDDSVEKSYGLTR